MKFSFESDFESDIDIILQRDVSKADIEHLKLDVMPGFRISWWYTDPEVTSENLYSDNERNEQFNRWVLINAFIFTFIFYHLSKVC